MATNEEISILESKVRREIRVLFKRHDVVSLNLKGDYPDWIIDVGVIKRVDNFPNEMKIDCLDKFLPINIKETGRIIAW